MFSRFCGFGSILKHIRLNLRLGRNCKVRYAPGKNVSGQKAIFVLYWITLIGLVKFQPHWSAVFPLDQRKPRGDFRALRPLGSATALSLWSDLAFFSPRLTLHLNHFGYRVPAFDGRKLVRVWMCRALRLFIALFFPHLGEDVSICPAETVYRQILDFLRIGMPNRFSADVATAFAHGSPQGGSKDEKQRFSSCGGQRLLAPSNSRFWHVALRLEQARNYGVWPSYNPGIDLESDLTARQRRGRRHPWPAPGSL
jgi:hypothetical protein